ncbi:MAG: phosphate regulon sensor protein PhoR, partial [Mucilaginibacter sp.]|nr:phosphate regulon sensor protein PhoR [Mucilaginibacter sp.]
YPLLHNGEVNLLAGIAEDISVLKKNIFYAEKINARKNSTLAILAHDLKGSMGLINMMASTIQKDINVAGNENILKPVQFIQDLCKRNIDIIRNLIEQEFLESPEVDLRKERVDLIWSINDIIQNYKKSENVLAKKFILNSSVEKLYIQMDTLKMMQVLNNLITNAIKFTPENGVIEVDIKDMDTLVQIIVRDNGIGIPENLQPYLFDKFTRSRRTGLQGEEPIGLGMSIIKTIVELHNGRIWFDTKENKGSSFYIEIPKF